MDYYSTVVKIVGQLAIESEDAESKIKKLPQGELRVYSNGKYGKYYRKLPSRPLIYIPASQKDFIEELGRETYLQQYLKYHKLEKQELEKYLATHQEWAEVRTQLLQDFDFLALKLKQHSSLEQELRKWETAPYEQCPYYPEGKIVEGARGIMMRSKGEGDISVNLQADGEPFHYEQLWKFPEGDIYPDFTIRHPQTGDYYIWEHFGLMDKPDYVQETARKLQIYEANGFCPGHNLIVTYEDKAHPLSHRRIMNEIQYFFH